jgi:hypothetical protein
MIVWASGVGDGPDGAVFCGGSAAARDPTWKNRRAIFFEDQNYGLYHEWLAFAAHKHD